MTTGGCLCGVIRYEVDQTRAGLGLHCHCKDCQRVTGSGKATVVMFANEDIKIDGKVKIYASRGTDGSHVNRGFCPTCGSQLFTFVDEIPNQTFVKAGTLDNSEWVTVGMTCWTDSASTWSRPELETMNFSGNPSLEGE